MIQPSQKVAECELQIPFILHFFEIGMPRLII